MTQENEKAELKVKTIYDLKLHEYIVIGESNLEILRVPGGWIYKSVCQANEAIPIQSVFVPHNDEFSIPF